MWHRWQAKVVWKPHKNRKAAPEPPSVELSPCRVVAAHAQYISASTSYESPDAFGNFYESAAPTVTRF